MKKSFASDNYAGIHPEIIQHIMLANAQHAPAYGADEYTAEVIEIFKQLFTPTTEVAFVYNGTGANVLGLSVLAKSFESIFCAEVAHIHVDESTAPEKFIGCRLVTLPSTDGKIKPEQIESKIQRIGDQHHPQARVISISQPTEYGTIYTPEEIREISAVARKHNMFLHMDGSRISNAAVSLNTDFRNFTCDAGVDVLSFGGTKNGMMFGEAVLIFQPTLASNLRYIRKQAMQLHSKMRFISAQFKGLFTNQLWKRNASHSNAMAKRLAEGLSNIPHVKITQRVEANGVFAIIPTTITKTLQQEFAFYVWNDKQNEIRLMCSFDTTEEEVDLFIERLATLINASQI
jgi:threonine aldolase